MERAIELSDFKTSPTIVFNFHRTSPTDVFLKIVDPQIQCFFAVAEESQILELN